MDQQTAEAISKAFLHGMSAGAALISVLWIAFDIWRSRRDS